MLDRGVDISAEVLTHSWRWVRVQILGLLNAPPLYRPDGSAIHSTRLGLSLYPPKASQTD